MTMRYVFSKSKPDMKFSNAPIRALFALNAFFIPQIAIFFLVLQDFIVCVFSVNFLCVMCAG